MKAGHSFQYGTPCVIYNDPTETADDVIETCREIGAIFHEEGPDDECFVVELRRDIGPELWTEGALRRNKLGVG